MKFVEPPPNEAFLPDSLIRAGWRCPSGGAGVLPSVLAPRRRLHVTPAHALGFLTIVDLASDSVALGFEIHHRIDGCGAVRAGLDFSILRA
jgi:hypothetical protein